ncbi:EpsG family protein [Enterococcus wangshanyuanii]|uniref:Transmembrane protein EpsG n=1 Tax=Enterococcus wangshanyuanii TaxID=2005703 RepID=A0ABQ1PQG0_9ENTE|nr:EpsG family protein [Enterococcus wangshanyuanii]GGD01197.1 transmembrane protein EpsG [Enterococcus wangshanyuanii]
MYTIIFFSSLLLAFLMEISHRDSYFQKDSEGTIRVKKSFFLLAFLTCILYIVLVVAPAIRYRVGTDYSVYLSKQIPEVLQGIPNSVEFLYKGVIHLGNSFGNYQWIFVITHVIIILFTLVAIIRDSKNYWISIIVLFGSGFFNYSMNIMRQSIAISIFLFSIHYLVRKENRKYIFWIIVATLFHKTSIIYFALLFLKKIKLSWKQIAIFSIGLYVFKTLFRSIILAISNKFNFYNNQFGTLLDSNQIGWMFLIANSLILLLFLLIKNRTEFSSTGDLYLQLQFIAFAITLVSDVVPNYERLMYMFMIGQILSVPYFFKRINSRIIKWCFVIAILVVYGVLFHRLFIIGNIGETFPYQSIFN